jgi:hypothetical protein
VKNQAEVVGVPISSRGLPAADEHYTGAGKLIEGGILPLRVKRRSMNAAVAWASCLLFVNSQKAQDLL